MRLSVILSFFTLLIFQANPASSQKNNPARLLQSLEAQTEGDITVEYHSETGLVRFLAGEPDLPLVQANTITKSLSAEKAAGSFLSAYGELFGLKDPGRELAVRRTNVTEEGAEYIHYQQVFEGIPVLGGELIIESTPLKDIAASLGEILPDIAIETKPALAADEAVKIAVEEVAQLYSLPVEELIASTPELRIYNPALIGGPDPRITSLVWQTEVTTQQAAPIRELVLVDAQRGSIALHFNQVDMLLNREIYDNNDVRGIGLPGFGPVRVEGQAAITNNDDANDAYDFLGDTYDFYYSKHYRDSIDGAGMKLIATTHYCEGSILYSCPYPNAFWNGYQMAFGRGYASADDVVAHELTHGVTQYESNLYYYYQSGAINEAFSDIWGEFVDLQNGKGDDTSAARWWMGEDLPIGAIRYMKDPTVFFEPDRMTSPYYSCDLDEQDNGGVHTNSGVLNKAVYLMVDGGSFNGYQVTGLGIDKVAKILYRVQTSLLTSGSDYQDLYSSIQQACTTLVGTYGITATNCAQVKNALLAVEMNQSPTQCLALDAPTCEPWASKKVIFQDDLENPASGNWMTGAMTGENRWYYPPIGDSSYATSGENNFWGSDGYTASDFYIALTKPVTIPTNTDTYLHFNHAFGFEDTSAGLIDGGVIEYTTVLTDVTSTAVWKDAGPLFTNNGYNGRLATATTNPLGGRLAFVSESNGYISSEVKLSSLAGKRVSFRFRMGTNETGTMDWGWFVDDIQLYSCTAKTGISLQYLPIISRIPRPLAGYWDGAWSELYVTPDRQNVDNFTIYVSLEGCPGVHPVTYTGLAPIRKNTFSVTGSFQFSGEFTSEDYAEGQVSLDNHYIPQCKVYVYSKGYFSWNASYINSTQPPLSAFPLDQVEVRDVPKVYPAAP